MFCIVMEYVPGINAASLVAEHKNKKLDWRLAAHIIRQVLEGIEEAHAHGIIHRDIKPENILIVAGSDDRVSVKLADFGIAKALANAGLIKPTVTGERKGTLAYMAPEQARDSKRVGFAADIYSVGATLYTLLTGQFAREFPEDTAPLLVVMENKVVPILDRDRSIPPRLAAVVERALRTSPAERYQSAREMLDDLP
jgi:serine/threonine-protein kinase